MTSPYCRNDNSMIAPHHRRSTAVRMLRLGQITINEAAQIALVSRQRVRVWCENAGIDPRKARQAWIAGILQRMNKRDRK
jgi:hypothetical protein